MKLWRNHRKKLLAALGMLLLGLLAVIAGTVYFLGSEDFRTLAAENIVTAIESPTGMAATLDAFEVEFLAGRFSLVGLVLRGEEDPSDPPLLSIDRVDIGLRWRALLNRELDLSSLAIVRPRLRLEIGDDGSTNVPSPPVRAGGGGPDFEVSVGDLVLSGGEFRFNEERVDVDFTLGDLVGRFDYLEASRVLSGHIEYAGAVERLNEPVIPYDLSADFDYTAGVALIRAMEVSSGESRLELQGRIDDVLARRSGVLAYTGSVALPFLNHFFDDNEFEGEMDVVGSLDFSTTHFASMGRMTSSFLRFDDWSATELAARYSYDFPERVLVAEDFNARVFGGTTSGVVRVAPLPGSSRIELDLDYRNVLTASFRNIYPWGPDYVLDARASGTMDGWFRGSFEDFDLSGRVAFSPSGTATSDASVSLSPTGSTRYRGTPGQVELEGLAARLGQTDLEASGVVRAADFSLRVAAASGDLRDLAFLYPGARGAGTFDGELGGGLARPDVRGQFVLEGYDVDGWIVDRLAGGIDLSGDRVGLGRVEVDVGASRAILDGQYDLGTGQPDLDVEIAAWNVSDVSRFLPISVEGVVSGRVHLNSLEPLSASGILSGADLVYADQRADEVGAEVTVEPDRIELRNARIRQGEAEITGDLSYAVDAETMHLEFSASGHRIEELQWLGVPMQFQGVVQSARFVVDGSPTSPLIAGQTTIRGLQFREQFFDEARITVENDGQVVTAAIAAGDRLTIGLRLDPFTGGFPFEGDARFSSYDASSMAGLDEGTVVASGTATFTGRLSDFETIEGSGEVAALRVRLDEDEILSPPFTFEFDTDEVELSSVDLADETTSITVDGTVSLAPEAPLDLNVLGSVDLGQLSATMLAQSGLEIVGAITFNGNVVGTLSNPQLDGTATLDQVTIAHPALFLSLSGLNGEMAFDRDRVTLIDVEGTAGGGTVSLGGTIGVVGIRPAEMDLILDARDIRVRTPEGLRTVFNAALSLRGSPEAPSLEGNVDVVSLAFHESFEEFLALFGTPAGGVLPSETGPLDPLALAVHVQGERGIHIENELARVDARLDLDIGGTFGQPTMTGHVESVDGVLDLQGNRYLITRGNVDFVDPVGIEPRIDVQAETDLRDYRVILTLSGTADNIRIDMTSDPPLPQLEIVSLMAGGRTREELAGSTNSGAVPTSEELFQGAAATVVSDLLQERVGSRFGLGSLVRIDPFLVGAENDPVARVTVSEQVTRDLIITYSQDLSSNRQEIILIEYFLDNNTSFIASRDETGAVGLDIRLRKRFR